MATDEERREVARRLRRADADGLDYDTAWCWVLDDALATKGLGWSETFRHLADLIEPAPTSSDTAPTCDRGALLALAEEMDKTAPDYSSWEVCEGTDRSITDEVRDYASRIREACGEDVEER